MYRGSFCRFRCIYFVCMCRVANVVKRICLCMYIDLLIIFNLLMILAWLQVGVELVDSLKKTFLRWWRAQAHSAQNLSIKSLCLCKKWIRLSRNSVDRRGYLVQRICRWFKTRRSSMSSIACSNVLVVENWSWCTNVSLPWKVSRILLQRAM